MRRHVIQVHYIGEVTRGDGDLNEILREATIEILRSGGKNLKLITVYQSFYLQYEIETPT